MIKFIKTADPDNMHDKTDIALVVKDPNVTWPELMEEFKHFLRACGYAVPDDLQ